MQGSGVTVVKEAGQFFSFGVLALHGRLEQCFLNIARHVTRTSMAARPSKFA